MTIGELGYDFQYITDEDRAEFQRFCMHHLAGYGRPMVDVVWHYTSAEGLIEILKSGKIFSTQVSCLNDSKEQRFFGDLIHEKVKELKPKNTDLELMVLYDLADDILSKRDFSVAWHFVSCFSEIEDDLGQWRGYGSGNCGYAIGFNCSGLLDAVASRKASMFLPMQYDHKNHMLLVDDTIKVVGHYFKSGIKNKHVSDISKWATEFLIAFSWQLDIYASITKHHKFSGEIERRIVAVLQDEDRENLEFKQKQTLLAHHLPIDITVGEQGSKRLPINSVYVGPGTGQRVSQVSINSVLTKYGYHDIPVKISSVPYRIP